MALQEYKIESVIEGWSETNYFGRKGTYNSSIGVDPDLPVGTDTKTSGVLVPSRYEKFSGTEFTGYPLWILPNNKTSNTIIYTSDGKLHSFNSSLAMRTTDEAGVSFPITITGGAGNGAAFYNNFYYVAEATDISQYGGMDQGASIAKTENVWTGAKFGLSALTNTTYPSVQGVPIPNHPMHVHTDNSNYIGDVVAGQGVVHRMNTKKTTIEGDTNGTTVPSAFNALDLPFGYYPTDFESYGTDLVIAAIYSTNSTINQGKAALFFWDPTNTDTFYRQVALPDPLVTALLNVNGILYIWSGNSTSGVRLSQYIGGETIQEVAYMEDGVPPFAGAVDAIGSRLSWGTMTTYPEASASVFAYGSKIETLPKGLHNIVRTTSAGATPTVSAIKYVQQADNITPRLVAGWGDGSAKGLDKLSTTATFNSIWRSEVFNINDYYLFKKLGIPLAAPVDANTSVIVRIYIDDASTTVTLPTINNTTQSGKRRVQFEAGDLKEATGDNNFFIEIEWNGTTKMPVLLPIRMQLDVNPDKKV
jgi:hypothetical protein